MRPGPPQPRAPAQPQRASATLPAPCVAGLRVHHARPARVQADDGSHFHLEPAALPGGVSVFRVRSSVVREVRYEPAGALLVHAPVHRDDWSVPADTRFPGGERRSLRYRPGQVALTDGTLAHAWSYGGCETLSLAVPLPASAPGREWDEALTPDRLRAALHAAMFRTHDHPLLRGLVLHFWRAAAGPVPRLMAEGAAAMLLGEVARLGGAVPAAGRRGGRALATWRLRRALDYMEARLAEDVALADVAAAAGVSLSHFQHAFRASTGEPPYRWLVRRRIELARELLSGTELPIAAVALAAGFATQAHLTTTFRRLIGGTPAAYREAMRR